MNNSEGLHWSFDYNYGAQNPQFAQQLVETFLRFYAEPKTDRIGAEATKHVYDIFPNYWRGYARGADRQDNLSLGEAVIKRQQADDARWHYTVQYTNTTSGEELQLRFHTANDLYRSLTGKWYIQTQNSCQDSYSRFACEGQRVSDEIRLTVNQAEITLGLIQKDTPFTCNWALFDVIPALSGAIHGSDRVVEMAVLEDLEKLRPMNRIGFLESIQMRETQLDGYYLYGEGLLPSYWWLDMHGNVAIFANFFQTFVLKEIVEGSA
jgi:hypothetical protein